MNFIWLPEHRTYLNSNNIIGVHLDSDKASGFSHDRIAYVKVYIMGLDEPLVIKGPDVEELVHALSGSTNAIDDVETTDKRGLARSHVKENPFNLLVKFRKDLEQK